MAQQTWMETVTLGQVSQMIRCLAHEQSLLLLSGPGVGKSEVVYQAAAEAGLPCRSLVGTQIAPEDVSGIPRIIGERSVFCPPRVLLPEKPEPFCLFLDELPACAPDVQKAFYSLLLDRRLGEYSLPTGTWVVAAGNRIEDRSLVRALSSALVNRVIVLQVRVDVEEWLAWARKQRLRADVVAFIREHPEALQRPMPARPGPFSTPRAWTSLAQALDRIEAGGGLTPGTRLALAAGRVSSVDAEAFFYLSEERRTRRVALNCLHLTPAARVVARKRGLTTLGQVVRVGPPPEIPADEGAKNGKNLRSRKAGHERLPVSLARAVRVYLKDIGFPETWITAENGSFRIHVKDFAEASVSLWQAKDLLRHLAREQSLLLLAPPGVGKTAIVAEAAAEAGLPCRSLLGTQIAPEDVSGIPRVIGERSVFCPPRVLLPEKPEPFCLFLDELPACTPDVQKAFYPLLLERRLGEHALPAGSWVVAAGNRSEDRALVRDLSAALVNRVFLIHVRVDADEWFHWAEARRLREEVRAFLWHMPEALVRPIPAEPVPFSTPRAWTQLAEALDLAENSGILTREVRRALTFGRLSPEDAALFCAMAEESLTRLRDAEYYLEHPAELPVTEAARWFVLSRIRRLAETERLNRFPPAVINSFLRALSQEHRLGMLVDLVHHWGRLGADPVIKETLWEVTELRP